MGETLKGNVKLESQFGFPPLLTWYIVDYNSWQESDEGLRLATSLDKNVVLAEGIINIAVVILTFINHCTGYKEYNTHRKYLAKMGDWRNNKDEEVELDGIGGVNILVKADVHRSGSLRLN